MTERELLVRALAQMIAPRLFVLSGDNPAEMGFPFADSEGEFNERVERQFDPISFWTAKAEEIAEAVIEVLYGDGDVPAVTDDLVARTAAYAEKWQPVNETLTP